MTEDMYLRIKQVTIRTGLSRATIYGMMDRGTFPVKTALGVRAVGWLASEIDQWMRERKVVEKIGVEAAPGQTATKRKTNTENKRGKSTASILPAQSPVRQTVIGRDVDVADADAWGATEQPPTQEEMMALHSARSVRKKKVNLSPVTSFTKRPEVDVTRPRADTASARAKTEIRLFPNGKKPV